MPVSVCVQQYFKTVFDDIIDSCLTDPSTDDNSAIRWASENGHIDVVERLLQGFSFTQYANRIWVGFLSLIHCCCHCCQTNA